MREVSVWNWTLYFLSWEKQTPATHKGMRKKFSNHASCSDYDLTVAELAALPSLIEKGMHELADDSVGRVIYHLNVIPDGPYSADSTKNRPYSLREAFIAEKEELKKIVANEGRVIRSIAEACGGKGGTTDAAAAFASAKSTPVKKAVLAGNAKASERTILQLQHSLEQVQEYNKRLKVDLATSKGGGVMGGGGGGVGGGGVGGGGGRLLGRGGAAVGGLVVPDRARPFPSLFTLAKTVVPPVARPGFCTVTAGSEGIRGRSSPGRALPLFSARPSVTCSHQVTIVFRVLRKDVDVLRVANFMIGRVCGTRCAPKRLCRNRCPSSSLCSWVGGGKRETRGVGVAGFPVPPSRVHTECCTLDRSRLSALIEFLRSVLRERGRGFLDLNCFPSKRIIVVTVTVTHRPNDL